MGKKIMALFVGVCMLISCFMPCTAASDIQLYDVVNIDLPVYQETIAEDIINNYAFTGTGSIEMNAHIYPRNEGYGFAYNWSADPDKYTQVDIGNGCAVYYIIDNTTGWVMSYRGPAPTYRAFSEPIDFSNEGTYTFLYQGYEYGGTGANLLGSDHRIYLGSTAFYFGYTPSESGSTQYYVPNIKAPGMSEVQTGTPVAYANKLFNIRFDVVVNNGADDELKFKMWYTDQSEPNSWNYVTTCELGNRVAEYVGFTANPEVDNGSRYVKFLASYKNEALRTKIIEVSGDNSSTTEEIRDAFASLSLYPAGSEKDAFLSSLRGMPNASGAINSKIILTNLLENNTRAVASGLDEVYLVYDYAIDAGSEFALVYTNEQGTEVPVNTSTVVDENKVTISILDEVLSGTEYKVITTGATDYKGDTPEGITFATYAIAEISVKDGDIFDKEATIYWDASEVDSVTATLKYPDGSISEIQNNTTVTQAGEYELTIVVQKGNITDTAKTVFTVLPDIAPIAENIKISGKAVTGETLTVSYDFKDENPGDSEEGTVIKWYRAIGEGKVLIGEGETYTLTTADDNHNIIACVTPKSNSDINPVGEETFSQPFTGAYAPVASNVIIDGEIAVDSRLKVTFDYYDINEDDQGSHIIKWYLFGGNANTELIDEVIDGTLKLTNELMGKTIYATVTPVSAKMPYYGEEVASEPFELTSEADSATAGSSDFPVYDKKIAEDVLNNYEGLKGTDAIPLIDFSFVKNEGVGFTHNWSAKNGKYSPVGGAASSICKVDNDWAISYRGPDPIYRALKEEIDFSKEGTYTFIYDGYEYGGENNLLGSDHRIYIGSEDWYFGYKGDIQGGKEVFVPMVKLPGVEDAVTGMVVENPGIIRMKLEVTANNNSADTFKLKLWKRASTEPAEWNLEAEGEMGDAIAQYLAYTPNAGGDSGSRYLAFYADYEYVAMKNRLQQIATNDGATNEEIKEAFAVLSTYPEGDEKSTLISAIKALPNAAEVISATVTETNLKENNTRAAAHDLSEIFIKYNYALKSDSTFKLVYTNNQGNEEVVETSTKITENKVTVKVDGELQAGTEYRIVPDNASDYKGDSVPGITFTTYSVPKFSVADNKSYSELTSLAWDVNGTENVSLSLTLPDGTTREPINGERLSQFGEYILTVSADKGQLSDTITMKFSVVEDVAPVASDVRIIGMHKTGATLTGKYTFSDANYDSEDASVLKWYRVSDNNKTEIAEGLTYTLTEADENHNIVFGVTPKANSIAKPYGVEVYSDEFTAAYSPEAKNVKFGGENKFGEQLIPLYTYYDENGDDEAETLIKWYFEDGNEIADNIENNKLKVTEELFEKSAYFEVTPVSVSVPNVGKTVRSEILVLPSAPVVSNVRITGNAVVGGSLTADYEFNDANFDIEGKSRFEWKNVATGKVIGTEGTLVIDKTMAGITVSVTVIGVSERIPTDSAPVTSSPIVIGGGSTVSGGLGGAVSSGGNFGYNMSGGSGGGGGSSSGGTTTPVAPVTPVTPVQPEGFGDISGHWAKAYVEKLEEAGIVKSDKSFRPDDSISRAELLAMLFRAANAELSVYADSFGDVKADDWFAGYIQTALDAGVVSEADSFRPNDAITREETAKIVASLLKLATDVKAEFADNSEISDWAAEFVNAVSAAGIFKGDENGNFNPKGKLTRAETATVICRLLESGAFADEEASEKEESTEKAAEENILEDTTISEGTQDIYNTQEISDYVYTETIEIEEPVNLEPQNETPVEPGVNVPVGVGEEAQNNE